LKLVLGLTGPNAAGKGEVASWLSAQGFVLHSLSDIVREEAVANGLPPEREHLIATGNRLRNEGGAGVLAARLIPRLGVRDVVDSIRNPAEVQALRSIPQFVLAGVEASMEARFKRSLLRARPGDPLTLEQFRHRENQENSSDPNSQQLAATFALADHILVNDGEIEHLHEAISALIDRLSGSGGS
jgi:dephospho-CoA kinase